MMAGAFFGADAAEKEFQALTDVEPLQDLVLVGDLEVEIRRGEIGETARIRDVHLENRGHLVRNSIDELGQGLRCQCRIAVVGLLAVRERAGSATVRCSRWS